MTTPASGGLPGRPPSGGPCGMNRSLPTSYEGVFKASLSLDVCLPGGNMAEAYYLPGASENFDPFPFLSAPEDPILRKGCRTEGRWLKAMQLDLDLSVQLHRPQ